MSSSCSRPAFVLPSGAGAPAPDAPAAWAEATSRCRGTQTFSAELRVTGRAGASRLRGTILAGVTSAGQIRLIAPAPFGRPAFVLAGTRDTATLVTRDNHVLAAPAERILEALVGVSLDPASLVTLLSGCGLADAPIQDAVRYPNLLAIRTAQGRAFLESLADHWRVVAVERSPLLVEYRHDRARSEAWPRQLRLTSLAGQTPSISLSMSQSQIEVNVPLPAAAFTVQAPADAMPLSLEELKAAGPLGEGR